VKESEDMRNIRLTLILYIVIFVLKIAIYAVTGVMALFAEAFHTLADIIIAAFLLVASVVSHKRADERPYVWP
jgi:divalent metal cation (Fe/Co/Zn/Cd) transporter